jgi:hypothetical protein
MERFEPKQIKIDGHHGADAQRHSIREISKPCFQSICDRAECEQ